MYFTVVDTSCGFSKTTCAFFLHSLCSTSTMFGFAVLTAEKLSQTRKTMIRIWRLSPHLTLYRAFGRSTLILFAQTILLATVIFMSSNRASNHCGKILPIAMEECGSWGCAKASFSFTLDESILTKNNHFRTGFKILGKSIACFHWYVQRPFMRSFFMFLWTFRWTIYGWRWYLWHRCRLSFLR